MKIHEYQAKEILAKFNIPIPQGKVAFSVTKAVEIAKNLPAEVCVVKAQIHAGGRGKGGGIKICKNPQEVAKNAEKILGSNLITPQTLRQGQKVNKILIEQGLTIKKELYLSILIDRLSKQPLILASLEGGMDIEEVAEKYPAKIVKQTINPVIGFRSFYARQIAFELKLNRIDPSLIRKFEKLITKLYKVFIETDSSLLEINPLIITEDNEFFPLDCKINLDDNALYRHPELSALRDFAEENTTEITASEHDLNFIKLDGNIGCMVNGAGLAMGTMDIIKYHGGNPANFLDVGGGTNAKKVAIAFKLLCQDKNVKVILVNIFGGIVSCDLIAEGVLEALTKTDIGIPLILRLEGNKSDKAKNIIEKSIYKDKLLLINDLTAATKKAVALAK